MFNHDSPSTLESLLSIGVLYDFSFFLSSFSIPSDPGAFHLALSPQGHRGCYGKQKPLSTKEMDDFGVRAFLNLISGVLP